MIVVPLYCSSMAHVADRAWGFLFCDPPYRVAEVRPDGVILERPDSPGVKGATLLIKVAPPVWSIAKDVAINATVAAWQAECKPPARCFIDEVNDSPIKPLPMYAEALLEATLTGKFPPRR